MTELNKDKKYIDIAKIISESNSRLLKQLPKFVITLVSKIIRQDEMNRYLRKLSAYSEYGFLLEVIKEFNLKLEIEGKENLPENGKCFFVANHPFGVIDGLVLTFCVCEKYGTLKAIANDGFMFIPQLRPFIAAVNVYGQSPKEYVKALEETYNMDIPITHFPSGEVSRIYNWKVQDREWQKSFITKAIPSQRDIVPIHIGGKNSILFYSIFSLRRLLGIKANIELMLIPREMFNKKNKTIKVKIGKPISYRQFDKSLAHRDWANVVRSKVYELGKN
ncbi:MAG: 1-acyl-sn-glycerol-3-phosphate acyltransferase [bacterium]